MPPNINIPARCPSPPNYHQFSTNGENTSLPLINATVRQERWYSDGLVITVIGASGDLAKKKTYPSLFKLYCQNLLPSDTIIWGFARSKKTHESLRSQIKPYLLTSCSDENVIDIFLSHCYYHSGSSYGDLEAFSSLTSQIMHHEETFPTKSYHNRLFYLAIPPNVFADASLAIKEKSMAKQGWTRIIIEKPFGRDSDSCLELSSNLAQHFEEKHLYRIDHYLGKEMVQNLLTFRFGNSWLEWLWNRNAVKCVLINFKEPFGTEGRGGYFDQYGIIRDIIQNHLLQVLSLLTMESPIEVEGPEAGNHIRDAKVHVLKSIPPVTLSDCLLGQYEGYTNDSTIENKSSNCPTFAAIRCFINTPRWHNVPFIFTAGKALDERKVDIRVQFKEAPAAVSMLGTKCPHNELVMTLQPKEEIYMKTNIKSPGFSSMPIQTSMSMNYHNEFDMADSNNSPDAYSRLILDVMRGKHGSFVRDDELKRSWEIFTPLLKEIDEKQVQPVIYKYGSAGPDMLQDFIKEMGGYVTPTEHNEDNYNIKRDMRKSAL